MGKAREYLNSVKIMHIQVVLIFFPLVIPDLQNSTNILKGTTVDVGEKFPPLGRLTKI